MGRGWVGTPGLQQRQPRNGCPGVPALSGTFLPPGPTISHFWRSNPKIFRNQTREHSTRHYQPLARTESKTFLAYDWARDWRAPLPWVTIFYVLNSIRFLYNFIISFLIPAKAGPNSPSLTLLPATLIWPQRNQTLPYRGKHKARWPLVQSPHFPEWLQVTLIIKQNHLVYQRVVILNAFSFLRFFFFCSILVFETGSQAAPRLALHILFKSFLELWSSRLPSAVWLVGILSLCFCVQFWWPFLLKITAFRVSWRVMLWTYLSLTGVVHSGFTPGSVPPTRSDVHTVHLWQFMKGPQVLGVTSYVCLSRWAKRGTSGPGTMYFV